MRKMLDFVRSWVGVVAILAVAMLGVLALDRSHDQRHLTIDRTFQAACERHASTIHRVNEHTALIDRNRDALAAALKVAAKERGQNTLDRLEYARLQGLLDSSKRPPRLLDTPDCEALTGR